LLFELKKGALKVWVIGATRHLGTFMCMNIARMVAGHFARDFLNFAFGLLDGALDSIFVYVFLSLVGSTFPR